MATDQRDASLKIIASLHAITRTLKRRAQAQHGDSLAILTVLSAVAVPGGVRASEVADHLLVDLSSVSRRISTLEAKGLVEKVVDSCDRRASLVALTASGQELLHSLRVNAGDRMSTALAHWSAKDLDQFVGLLARFEADLAAADAHPTSTSPALTTK